MVSRAVRQVRRAAIAVAIVCLSQVGPLPFTETARAQTAASGQAAVDGAWAAKQAEWKAANARIRAAIDAGRTGSLIGLAEDALREAELAFGPNARETLANVRYLADFNYEQGRYATAAPLYMRAIAGAGSQDDGNILSALDTLNSVNNLAVIYKAQGRYAAAEPLVASVAGVLAGKRHVFVAAGGALSSLPFGILVTESPKGADGDPAALRATKWFADAHALAVIPSIQALQFLRAAAAGSGTSDASVTFAGYGDPVLAGHAQTRGARLGKAIAARAIFQPGLSRESGGVANIADIRSMASLPGTGRPIAGRIRMPGRLSA